MAMMPAASPNSPAGSGLPQIPKVMDAMPNAAAEAAMVFLVFMASDDILGLRGCGY
nr:MAG TPA: hypothetical protein [Caudoviricetes sp.]